MINIEEFRDKSNDMLMEVAGETLDYYFNGKKPTISESITYGKSYKVRNDD